MCRAPRATWIQTELFLTFPTPAIKSIALTPLNTPETGGRFRVWLDKGEGKSELLWDRKVCSPPFRGAPTPASGGDLEWWLLINGTQEGSTDLIDGRRVSRAQSPQTALTKLHSTRDVIRAFRQTRDEGDPAVVTKGASRICSDRPLTAVEHLVSCLCMQYRHCQILRHAYSWSRRCKHLYKQ